MSIYQAWKQFADWTECDKARKVAKRQLERIEMAQAGATASA